MYKYKLLTSNEVLRTCEARTLSHALALLFPTETVYINHQFLFMAVVSTSDYYFGITWSEVK